MVSPVQAFLTTHLRSAWSLQEEAGAVLQGWWPGFSVSWVLQVVTRPSPSACTCVVGQKTIADVSGIPKPDTKLLAGCRERERGGEREERGRSQVLYIMKSLPPVCAISVREQARAQAVWPSFPEVPRIRKPACLSGGQSSAATADSSPRLWLGFCPGSTAFRWVW